MAITVFPEVHPLARDCGVVVVLVNRLYRDQGAQPASTVVPMALRPSDDLLQWPRLPQVKRGRKRPHRGQEVVNKCSQKL